MPVSLSKLALGPVLLAQGRWVRMRTPLLPEPPGKRTGVQGAGPPLSLLIVGDSSAAGVGAELQEHALLGQVLLNLSRHREVSFRLEAKTGATTETTLERLAAAEPGDFDLVVTSLGVNDVTSGATPEGYVEAQQRLRALLRERFGAQRIIVSGMPRIGQFPALPQPLAWYLGRVGRKLDAALVADLQAHDPEVVHVPQTAEPTPASMASDGFHPGTSYYQEWGRRIAAKALEDAPG